MMMNKKIIVPGVFLTIIVIITMWTTSNNSEELSTEPSPEQFNRKISVYVSGQVKNISVIELKDNGNLKLVDAINAAGGMTSLAAADAINLAAPLTDGQHIHVPTKEILVRQPQQSNTNFPAQTSENNLVNINTDNLQKLMTLKGIGTALAQRIIDYREQNGLFKSIEEIKKVNGIGEKRFEAIKNNVTI